ncbi:PIG-L family deacetylase [Pseudooceanicola sediminis]|uniref:PIG-L family deacetylase n=1 Tax=Pseudooceanicola sediminis TaxID=2211117 RepID=A0A399IXD2_9RHOB|nr:PIG-L deacetylase family protein [Pseudooceanicola sediminis]KAA2313166.1 PIG-L family deacetylase [Puniceibacterium sp. HSS470]RII37813.1 PIG-L family deacetylase [Pseudooceanicola sediminis]|tara:strand:- start:23112 stop:23858 length:747 start_codon:yes stop_codon:yes gene_type:complete
MSVHDLPQNRPRATTLPGRHVSAATLTGTRPTVVLAPHPDDESLGCGALLAHAFADRGAHVICVSDGAASHPGSQDWPPQRLSCLRRQELEQAIVHLGGWPTDLTWLGLSDSRLYLSDRVAVARSIAEICRTLGAHRLFAPAEEDHHADHKVTADIARRVLAFCPGLRLYSYPVWSRWDDPNFARTIARHRPFLLRTAPAHARKRAAIQAHASQLGQRVFDDPDGFTIAPGFVEKFLTEDEIFWRIRA